MPRLIWSPAALNDVQRVYRSLPGKNPDAARRSVKVIREGVRIIAQYPAIGRPVDHMENEFREWLIAFGASGYIALYRYDGETGVVLAERHQLEAGY